MGERSYDLKDMESEQTYLETLFRLYDRGQQGCIQGIVTNYNRETHIVKVRPLVRHEYRAEGGKTESCDRSEVEVPLFSICHGGYLVDIPVFIGDTGWIIAGDRNGTSVMAANSAILTKNQVDENGEFVEIMQKGYNAGTDEPDDRKVRQFAGGFFLPASWSKHEDEFFEDNMAIKSYSRPSYPDWDETKTYNKYDGVTYMDEETKTKKQYVCKENGTTAKPSDENFWKESNQGVDIYIGGTKWSFRGDAIYKNDRKYGGGGGWGDGSSGGWGDGSSGGWKSVGGGKQWFVSGPDSNVIFKDLDNGKLQVDVYYV